MGCFLFLVIITLGCCCYASDFFGGRNFHSFPGAGKSSGGTTDDEYYKVLGVDKQATDKDIKKAYRKLVG